MSANEVLTSSAKEALDNYLDGLNIRIAALDMDIKDEWFYYNTMPFNVYEEKKERDKLNQDKIDRYEQNIVLAYNPSSVIAPSRLLRSKKRSDPEGYRSIVSLENASRVS